MDTPTSVWMQGELYHFDRVAPITGDAIYSRETKDQGVKHILLPNLGARRNQLQYFLRGS